MNERLYGMQDGNWNMIAVCDTTGSVTERYAYSAYGAPVFMTGAGIAQTGSASDFETLYAGYRWDGESPQMYYVRNRFLLPTIGTWNRRDPSEDLSDFVNLLEYVASAVLVMIDPFGLRYRMPQMPRSSWNPRPSRGASFPSSPRPRPRPISVPRPGVKEPGRTGNPWGPPSSFPTVGEPRFPLVRPSNGPTISSQDPEPQSCTQQVLLWPQEIIETLPNPSGSNDCRKAFGFQTCPQGDGSVVGTLTPWIHQILRDLNAPTNLRIEFADCEIATRYPVSERTLKNAPHCTLGSPALNVHCRVLIFNTFELLPVIILVRDVFASTTCCLCCAETKVGVNCGAPHQGTTDKRPIKEALEEAVRNAT